MRCNTFGMAERIRVPSPAARMIVLTGPGGFVSWLVPPLGIEELLVVRALVLRSRRRHGHTRYRRRWPAGAGEVPRRCVDPTGHPAGPTSGRSPAPTCRRHR